MRGRGRDRLIRAAALATTALAMVAAPPATAASAQQTHVLVVSGLGGDAEYSARFVAWSVALLDAAVAAGVPAAGARWLAEREGVHPRAAGVARVDAVGAELAALAARSAPGDLILLVLFGHGSARGGEARINLPGPDLSAGELAAMLVPLSDRRLVVVNAASASGGFIAPLAAPGRVVITATRSSAEAEATRFGAHFVAGLAGAEADTDKDGAVSILEAFEYARLEVARSFEETGSLATEHALLEDDGDGRGSLEPGGADGALAARITLAPPTAAAGMGASGDPQLDRLRAERARLEQALAQLRARKDGMETEAYERELERLLLEIARTGRAIREREGAGS
ncbi:MAG TPA: hypothetical protein VMM12_16365 [Longimicrobiales bacterium]|nr:hypothetical protein [Longimicrobiales bacterium]